MISIGPRWIKIVSELLFLGGASKAEGIPGAIRGDESAGSERVRVRLANVTDAVPGGRKSSYREEVITGIAVLIIHGIGVVISHGDGVGAVVFLWCCWFGWEMGCLNSGNQQNLKMYDFGNKKASYFESAISIQFRRIKPQYMHLSFLDVVQR